MNEYDVATTQSGMSYMHDRPSDVTILIHGLDQRDQPIVFDAVQVMQGRGSHMAPKPPWRPWLTQNFAQWRQDRTCLHKFSEVID